MSIQLRSGEVIYPEFGILDGTPLAAWHVCFRDCCGQERGSIGKLHFGRKKDAELACIAFAKHFGSSREAIDYGPKRAKAIMVEALQW